MRKWPNIWITILLALLISVGTNLFLPKDTERYQSERFWIQKTFAPAAYDVVVMGDSRVYRGVNPEIMDSVLKPMRTLNFAYSNGGLNPEMFKAAEEKLKEDDNPKIIVLGISPNTVTGYSQANEQYRQEKTLSREARLEAIYLNSLKDWFAPVSLQKIRKILKNNKSESYYRNHYFMNGYVASEKFPVDTMEAIPSYRKDFSNYKVEAKYLDELYAQVKNWNDRGITVLGFRPPVPQPMRQLEAIQGLYNEDQIKSDFEKAGGHWVPLDPNKYKTYDGSHVTIESAQKLSAKLASEIKKLLNSQDSGNQ